ncbi:MAG: RdgB/HAM1 family non-canonical purine NTP pyrophosphatase [Pirellulales bacterium]|nr:RdgB/HAM1 family non-canonical purine NTP pyrophosphatase [Pirellulales bacterium]
MSVLILGTHNAKKGHELVELLAPHGIEVRTLAEVDDAIHVVEDGETFAANAGLKATQQAKHLGAWVLAEDSGLVVDALDGAPGVYSARFAGENATDEANNDLLLERLGDIPAEKRTAHYFCHMTLSDPGGEIRAEASGKCYGRITRERQGIGGFGYDPLFEVVEYHHTFGELGSAVKAALSHRARAMRGMLPHIVQLFGTEPAATAEQAGA